MDLSTIESWDLTYRDKERLQVSDNCELYFELEGQGPCVTFVSTIYVVSTAWRNFTRNLAKTSQILTYDLRNQGASSGSAAGFDQHATDLLRLLDHLDIEQTYLVGSSVSAVICRDFAVRYSERVRGLILVGPPFSPWDSKRRTRIMKSWLAALESGGPRQLFDVMYPIVFGDRAQAAGGGAIYMALRERFLAVNSAAQLKANLTDALHTDSDMGTLPKINAPALLIAGDDDFCVSPSTLRALAAMMQHARAEVYEECGHLPFFEATDRFEASVQDFIRSVESAERPQLGAHHAITQSSTTA